ncbi:MAG TPA: hypothetical protein VH370_18520 [Humisphaera sp.]|nr:hypothetical protein [Humisphaera sp.]
MRISSRGYGGRFKFGVLQMTYGNFAADSAARLPRGSARFSARQQGFARHGATPGAFSDQSRGGSHLT